MAVALLTSPKYCCYSTLWNAEVIVWPFVSQNSHNLYLRVLVCGSNELILGTVGSACMGSESHHETAKSLHICYLFNINLSYKDIGRWRTETRHIISEWAALGHTVIDGDVREWRQRLHVCIHAGGGHFEHAQIKIVWCDTYDSDYFERQ